MTTFWMVWKEHGGSPTVQHTSEAAARAEAERLAGTVGGRFYVLQALAACERKNITWELATYSHAASCLCATCVPF